MLLQMFMKSFEFWTYAISLIKNCCPMRDNVCTSLPINKTYPLSTIVVENHARFTSLTIRFLCWIDIIPPTCLNLNRRK